MYIKAANCSPRSYKKSFSYAIRCTIKFRRYSSLAYHVIYLLHSNLTLLYYVTLVSSVSHWKIFTAIHNLQRFSKRLQRGLCSLFVPLLRVWDDMIWPIGVKMQSSQLIKSETQNNRQVPDERFPRLPSATIFPHLPLTAVFLRLWLGSAPFPAAHSIKHCLHFTVTSNWLI